MTSSAALTVATGFAAGDHAVPDLAAAAVKDALANAGVDYAHSVILLLSGHFAHGAHHAQSAITAAARAASCLQVFGCTVPGVFTENSWALDQPAAAALVLNGAISLASPRDAGTGDTEARNTEPRLCLTLPSHAGASWIGDGVQRFGTLATGVENETDGFVWAQGKTVAGGRVEATLPGGRLRTAVSRGIHALTPPLEVNDCDNFEVLQLDGQSALDSLLQALDPETRKLEALPSQRFFAAIAEPGADMQEAMNSGRYNLVPILHVNRDERSVTLGVPLPLHTRLQWVIRDPVNAEDDMGVALDSLQTSVQTGRNKHSFTPAFGLMFSCIGRGPYFYQGHDRDVSLVRERFPDLPLIGAYGAGEIAPLGTGANRLSGLISYSTVLTLVAPDV